MKAKLISALFLTTVIFGTTAGVSNAQFRSNRPNINIQMQDGVPSLPGIDFSDDQKEKLKDVSEEVRNRMGEILTSEQQDDLKAAIKAGNNPKETMESFDLSSEDKTKLKKVQEWQRKEIFNVLTDEQKQKIMKLRQRQGGGNPFGNIRG